MAGNSISLFPIMMVGMMAYRPIQALMGYRDGKAVCVLHCMSKLPLCYACVPTKLDKIYSIIFLKYISSLVSNKLTGDQAALQKFSYILANLLGLAMAMYKCHTMGLLPTAQSDWIEFMDQRQVNCCTI